MSKSIYYSIAASAAFLLSACGDEVTEVTEVNEVGMKVIEKGENLPSCSSDNEGAMIYAVDSAAAYFCVNRKWTSMKGEKGDQGEPGKDGKQGKQGEKGDKGDKGDPGEQGEQGEKGDQGEKGEDGSSCTAELLSDSSGYKVVCNGDSIGVVLNGADGEKGDKGDQGEQGNKGDAGPKGDTGVGCSLLDDGNGSVKVTCGEGKGATTTTLYKAVCGNVPYDPEREKCDGLCGTKPFISTRYFCDDRDNQIYRFVTIGTQTWMAQNMNYKTNHSLCYNNEEINCETDGRLYFIGDSLEVCPGGWHLPDTSEYKILFNTVGGESIAGKMLKSSSGWLTTNDKDGSGTDAYGFSIVPAGSLLSAPAGASFARRSYWAHLWTRSQGENENGTSEHHSLRITGDSDDIIIVRNTDQGHSHATYYSVRCIKD